MIDMLGFLATPLGFIMRLLYSVIPSYGWTIILFTILVRILMIPLSLNQQKSTARMSAYQPMIQEIQKKWANDKARQNEEMQKFYEENQIKMTAGCLPMVVNMLVIFGMIAVIQAPLTYILDVPTEQIEKGESIVQEVRGEELPQGYTRQSLLIGAVKEYGDEMVERGMEAESVEKIRDFNFEFLGLDLSLSPTLSNWVTLILPILSILTMFLSQIIMLRTSGQAQGSQGKSMMITTLAMGVMFGFIAFTVPAGFSLYYTASNLVMTIQQFIVKRVYDPAKIKEEVMQEIEDRKLAKKAKKQVVVKTEQGTEEVKEVTESELNKIRLKRAREMDEEAYGTVNDQENLDAKGKAAQLDLEKYGKIQSEGQKALEAGTPDEGEEDEKETPVGADEITEDESPQETDAEPEGEDQEQEPEEQATKERYRPGRRKRARMKKEEQESQPEPAGDEAADSEQQDQNEEETPDE